jgi:putative ABC transport system ATP-binding protein
MLELKEVTKVFGRGTPSRHVALDHLNLTVPDGDFAAIVGSNGAGKSTLFNAVCGTFLPDSGHILLDNEDITREKEYRRAHKIGRVFQDPMLGTAPDMTIEENLSLAYARAKGMSFAFAHNKKDCDYFRIRLAEYGMGLEDRMDTRVGLLSGGQRQAVTLLMCTLVPPKLLLLDEHTAALDPATAEKVMTITRQTVEKHRLTTLMITHNLKNALTTGTRTLMMDSGRVLVDLDARQRAGMTREDLMALYAKKAGEALDNDRVLLS